MLRMRLMFALQVYLWGNVFVTLFKPNRTAASPGFNLGLAKHGLEKPVSGRKIFSCEVWNNQYLDLSCTRSPPFHTHQHHGWDSPMFLFLYKWWEGWNLFWVQSLETCKNNQEHVFLDIRSCFLSIFFFLVLNAWCYGNLSNHSQRGDTKTFQNPCS